MTFEEAVGYIESLSWKSDHAGLGRMTELCRLLGDPQRSLRFIHIAGTNGKGSVSAMLDAVLRAAGYRVGLFTSPHLQRFNDRIRFDGADIPDADLARATERVRSCAETMEDRPTLFEVVTAVALVYFRSVKCDWVVWECGLGGRLDSTNVVENTVLSVITGISLDHCHLLGHTTAAIAGEKAGIIKPGVPVLFGEGDDGAEAVIRRAARDRRCTYTRTDFSAISAVRCDLGGTDFSFGGRPVHIPLVGLYQTRNAATALTALQLLRRAGLVIPEAAVTAGLSGVCWKGRFEILCRDPLVIYDGAHNPHGVSGARENIRALLSPRTRDGKVILVMGVLADKDYGHMVDELAPCAAAVVAVRPDSERAVASADLAEEFRSRGVRAEAACDVASGVARGMALARQEGRPMVCLGSLYLYGQVKQTVDGLARG